MNAFCHWHELEREPNPLGVAGTLCGMEPAKQQQMDFQHTNQESQNNPALEHRLWQSFGSIRTTVALYGRALGMFWIDSQRAIFITTPN